MDGLSAVHAKSFSPTLGIAVLAQVDCQYAGHDLTYQASSATGLLDSTRPIVAGRVPCSRA